MRTDLDFFDSKLQPRRAALFDCVGQIFQKLDEWEEKVDLGRPSKRDEHIALWAAVHALEKLHRQASGPDITRWFASWTIAQLLAEIYTVTDSLDSDEEFSPRLAALRGCIVNINLKLKEWDDKINLGGPQRRGVYSPIGCGSRP
jgi:hypothetical protein